MLYDYRDHSHEAEAERERQDESIARFERFATPTKVEPIEASHTPGPWMVVVGARGRQIDAAVGGTVVADAAIDWLPDAYLVARAPDMRAALKRIRELASNYSDGAPDANRLARFANHIEGIADNALGGA